MTPKEVKYHQLYLDIATRVAEMSYAVRKKVGCVIVNNGTIIATGFNGMPSGMSNTCEHFEYGLLVTNSEVSHAEENALGKIARSTLSSDGATAYITMAPCINCAKLMYTSGIRSLVYRDVYKENDGITFLEGLGIDVIKL